MFDDIIDLAAVKDRLDNDRDFFMELVGLLETEVPNYVGRIATGISSNDAKAVNEAAHSLKSALGNLGSVKGRQFAYELELLGKGGNLSGSDQKLSALKAAIEEFMGIAHRIGKGELW